MNLLHNIQKNFEELKEIANQIQNLSKVSLVLNLILIPFFTLLILLSYL